MFCCLACCLVRDACVDTCAFRVLPPCAAKLAGGQLVGESRNSEKSAP